MGKRSREKRERREAGTVPENRDFNYQAGWEKACLLIVRWGTYLVLFTPLLVSTKFFFPFVAPKTIFFRIVVEIILAAYLILAVFHSRYRPRINLLTIALTLFLGAFILASFTGINFDRSFWSTNERMTGIWTMLHLYAFFIILTSCFKKREDWEKFLGVSVIAGVFLSLYVLKGNELSTRGGGTIGNTSFMGAYLLFDIFFALVLFLTHFLKPGGKALFWQIFSGASLAIMLPVLFTSTARGAIAAFCLGLFLLFLGYLIFSQKKALKMAGAGIILVLIVLAIILAVLQPTFVKEGVAQLLKDMKPRFTVWEGGWKGFLEKPILGWGPENFNVVFLKYFNPCVFLSECGGEIWFDRTHNIVLDTLVTTGVIGLLSYLAIFAAAIFGLLKTIPKIAEKRNIFFPLGLAVLLTVYFFQNLLVFDMINSYLVFFLTLAFTSFLIGRKEEGEEATSRPKQFNPVIGAVIIVAMIFPLWLGNIQPARANYYLIKALQSQYVEDTAVYFQKSLDSWMNQYEPREQFAQKMIKASSQDMKEQDRVNLFPLFEMAEIEMEKSVKENVLDFRPRLFSGQLYFAEYRFTGNKEKLNRAGEIFEKAIELSPTNQQGYWYAAEVKLRQGRSQEAISYFQKAIDLEPRLVRSHKYLGKVYQVIGDYQQARQTYLKALEFHPEDAELWAELAAVYANLGESEKAQEAAQKVREINPDLAPQVQEFLKDIE